MLIDILVLLLGVLTLLGGGELLVREAVKISIRANISVLVVGTTIVAFATSAPELVVCIYAAVSGAPDIAMGNVLGSNICNFGLILGVTALLKPISIRKSTIRFDWPFMMAASVLLLVFAWNNLIETWEGIIFVLGLLGFSYYLIYNARRGAITPEDLPGEVEDAQKEGQRPIIYEFLFLGLAILAMYFGSRWFVSSAESIAKQLYISERIIALTVVALGTSLPELITSFVAIYRKRADLAVGNVVGSNIFNILSILGITSIIQNVSVDDQFLSVDFWWMLGISFALLPLMLYKDKIYRFGGLILLLLYFSYIIFILL